MNTGNEFSTTASKEDVELILASGFFDEDFYSQQSGASETGVALVEHYLLWGEKKNLRPSNNFDPNFYLKINSDVEASGTSALLHFIKHGKDEGRLPSEQLEVDRSGAQDVAVSKKLFDPEYYAAQITAKPPGNLFTHYLTQGEKAGLSPSKNFSPTFYRDEYPDIAELGVSPLLHYISDGEREGRSPVAISAQLLDTISKLNKSRPTILVLIHETSMTGAPILGINIIKHLKNLLSYNVVSLSWRGAGPLSEAAIRLADVHIEPAQNRHFSPAEISHIVSQLCSQCNFRYCIANSSVVSKIALEVHEHGIPVIGLVHEFSSLIGANSATKRYFKEIEEIVFPAEIVRRSVVNDNEEILGRETHIITQGRSTLKGFGININRRDRPLGTDYLAPAVLRTLKASGLRVIAGLGTLEWRKGIDQFIACAAEYLKGPNPNNVRFVWIGEYHAGSYEAALYAEEQIIRSNLQDFVLFLPPTARIDLIYGLTDVLLMLPRLDPFPNVAIDALCEGIPVITCEGGTGVAEFLKTDDLLSQLVVDYLDAHSAAKVLGSLISDPDRARAISSQIVTLATSAFDMSTYVLKLDKIMIQRERGAATEIDAH